MYTQAHWSVSTLIDTFYEYITYIGVYKISKYREYLYKDPQTVTVMRM